MQHWSFSQGPSNQNPILTESQSNNAEPESDQHMTSTQALAAIVARQQGVFDDPQLALIGPLTTIDADVLRIKRMFLEDCGMDVGARNPLLNTDYPGQFMVCEEPAEDVIAYHERPTCDGSNGPWCIVGDDLNALIEQAFDVFVDTYNV